MKKLAELDGVRALMALLVYFSHVHIFSGLRIPHVELGGLAVTVFIILSGFAISMSSLHTRFTYGRYLARRFFRIYPIYLAGLLLGIATSSYLPELAHGLAWIDTDFIRSFDQREASKSAHFTAHLIAHLTLLHGAIPDGTLPAASITFNGPAWSLSLEWQFYLIAPLLLSAMLFLLHRNAGTPERRKGYYPFIAIPLYLVALLLMRRYFGPKFTEVPSFLGIQLLFFTIGMLTAIYLEPLSLNWKASVTTAVGLVIFCSLSRNPYIVVPVLIWVSTLLLCLWPATRVLIALREFLSNRLLVKAGEMSYSFYILHMPLLIVWGVILHRLFPEMTQGIFAIALCGSFPVTCVLSWLTYNYLESPINDWAKRRFKGAKTVAVTTIVDDTARIRN